jgi:hypothetical protein
VQIIEFYTWFLKQHNFLNFCSHIAFESPGAVSEKKNFHRIAQKGQTFRLYEHYLEFYFASKAT